MTQAAPLSVQTNVLFCGCSSLRIKAQPQRQMSAIVTRTKAQSGRGRGTRVPALKAHPITLKDLSWKTNSRILRGQRNLQVRRKTRHAGY
ncbi:hypothetical protein [Meridianimarinicoccus sp. MJW13]|uniref:hypothetical protein n=1 Tax=Meridianimarinicoccus sp. MJW13 TaxID=2720031 RepID=UPI001865C37E|nr:hypothetical protein [Fluviibacterium sp. MJW13]